MIDRFENFTAYIAQAHKLILKIKTHEMQSFGLKASHVMCLYYIGKHPEGLNAVELTTLCMEDKAGISKALAELKKKALIHSIQTNDSKIYRTRYSLTKAGLDVYKKANEIITKIVAECGEGLSDEERSIFYHILERIVSNLNTHCKNMETKENSL